MGNRKEVYWETRLERGQPKVTIRGEKEVIETKSTPRRDGLMFMAGVAAMAALQLIAGTLH
jgi:hypothetical protein